MLMAQESAAIDISTMPDVLRLTEEVRQTQQPRLLRRNGEDVALLVPVLAKPRRTARRRLSKRYPTIASLAGAAGSLPRPMSWKEVQEIVREERAAAYRAKQV
jgi:hypothetical protein